ncbi:MAG: PIG-L family deacetylase [Butyrivibrio sp.]|uniref:PIG-L deacetylase family protein n=1 Tax=Butyrivibrio sp. TaxID=28121 RepID=UPI0025B8571B|nr:PIG-L family deacetylase [Butyrivibrio sp.]MBQ6587160.1 PIG-L family deacetylase [Butyrivibrio sp.]
MIKLQIGSNNKILVIAPHPDDETYGCGGVLSIYKGQCDVVLLAYGETGNPNWTKDRTLRVRREEFRTAMKMAGATIVAEFGIANRRVSENLGQITNFDYSKYDYIFVPNRKDKHGDHSCVLRALRKCKTLKKGVTILQYEMWGALPDATHYLDISDVIDEKEKLMLCYKSQEERIPYCARIKARDYYKALETYDKKCQYAELFYLEPSGIARLGVNVKDAIRHLSKDIAVRFR